jgi:hypothetical protein
MAESDNSKERPDKPITDTPLDIGYDEKLWNWILSIENMAIELRNELLARINKLGVRDGGGGGANIRWAIVVSASDANNYVCNVYSTRGSYENGDSPLTPNADVIVPDIVDQLDVGDGFPVSESVISGEDYEAIQQMGAVG